MKKILITLITAALVFSCSDDDKISPPPADGSISVTRSEIWFDTDGTVVSGYESATTVTSGASWTIMGKQDWSKPSATSGENGSTVSFSADANDTGEDRQQTFIFVSGNATAEVTVNQIGRSLTVPGDPVVVNHTGGRITTVFITNGDVSDFETDAEWIKPYRVSSDFPWMQFDIDDYDGYTLRTGQIVFFKGRPEEKIVTIHQEPVPLTEYTGDSDIRLGVDYHEFTIKFRTNISNYRVMTSTNWLKYELVSVEPVDQYSNEVTLHVSAEEAPSFRSGWLTINDGVDDIIITVIQMDSDAEPFNVPDPYFSSFLLSGEYVFSAGNGRYFITEKGGNAKAFNFMNAKIGTLEGIENFPGLNSLNFYYSNLGKVDVSRNLSLNSVIIYYCTVSEVILGDAPVKNLSLPLLLTYNPFVYTYDLTVSGNNLLSLDMTGGYAQYDQLETLDVSGCTALTTLNAQTPGKRLTTIYMAAGQTIDELRMNDNTVIVYK